MKFFVACVIVLITVLTLLAVLFPSEQYTVPGYKHGTVICKGPGMIVINIGHQHDAEVQELLALADKCSE